MSTDFSDYFSQLAHSQADLWTQAIHWARDEGVSESKLGSCVLDLKLGFGASHGSNVSQRLSHALGAIFRTVNDAREEEYLKAETDPARLAYLRERRSLGHGQCRLWELPTYTDDPFLLVVGAKRLARAMELWNRLVKALGLAVAIPAKRQCGATVCWLGLDFFLSLGIVVIPDNKRLRMLTAIDSLAAGASPSFAEYRSTVSFLQYLKPFVAGADSSFFYGLYEPFRRGTPRLALQWHQGARRLEAGGCSVLSGASASTNRRLEDPAGHWGCLGTMRMCFSSLKTRG